LVSYSCVMFLHPLARHPLRVYWGLWQYSPEYSECEPSEWSRLPPSADDWRVDLPEQQPAAGFVYMSIPNSMIQTCNNGSTDSNAASLLAGYAAQRGNVWRLGMPEWDQSGGCWVTAGRPDPTGMADVDAYNAFIGFFQNALGFSTYLNQTAQQ